MTMWAELVLIRPPNAGGHVGVQRCEWEKRPGLARSCSLADTLPARRFSSYGSRRPTRRRVPGAAKTTKTARQTRGPGATRLSAPGDRRGPGRRPRMRRARKPEFNGFWGKRPLDPDRFPKPDIRRLTSRGRGVWVGSGKVSRTKTGHEAAFRGSPERHVKYGGVSSTDLRLERPG